LPELALFLRSPAEAEDDRQSYLTFAEVVTDILAEARRIARVIERIIDKLEGKSKIGAVRAQRCPIRLGGIRYNWAYFGCRRKERSGLGLNDGEIFVLGGLEVLGNAELQHFAFSNHRSRCR